MSAGYLRGFSLRVLAAWFSFLLAGLCYLKRDLQKSNVELFGSKTGSRFRLVGLGGFRFRAWTFASRVLGFNILGYGFRVSVRRP